jgi:hypothetical protein
MLYLSACNNNTPNNTTSTADSTQQAPNTDSLKNISKGLVYETSTDDKQFSLKVSTDGESATAPNLTIIGSSAGQTMLQDSIRESDPVAQVFNGRIGKAGQLFFIATQSGGSGSYGNLFGYLAGTKDWKKLPALPELDKQIADKYMGHDTFYVSKNYLIREFPLYKAQDTNATPTGGKMVVQYDLGPGLQWKTVK